MWQWLKEWRQLRSIERSINLTKSAFARDRKALGEKPSRDKLEELYQHEGFEMSMLYDERDEILSRRLVRKAAGYGVPTPSLADKEAWELSHSLGTWSLTAAGAQMIRAAIREEVKYRRDVRISYAQTLIAILGLLVALAALGKDFWIWVLSGFHLTPK